jgi:GNAT superfamily N-acetyltransferase
MDVQLSEEPIGTLAALAQVPSAFTVDRVLDVTASESEPGKPVLRERRLSAPYLKDYDALPGEGPRSWARRFDVASWKLIVARVGDRWLGGAVIARHTAALDLLEGRSDLAVLWDIRVAPDLRGNGVGSALFRSAEAEASASGCRQLKIETQNINVPACRFYARHGCALGGINPLAYPDLPGEVQLLWYKDLTPLSDQSHSAFMLPYSFRLQDWDRRCSIPPDRPPPGGSHARS